MKIDLTDLEVDHLIFRVKADDHRATHYVVANKDIDYVDFLKKFASGDTNAQSATPVNFSNNDERFYLVYVADCAFPPFAVVRAENEGEAEAWFTDELTWSHIDTSDMTEEELNKAADDGTVNWNDSGKAYDPQGIMVQELKLIKIGLKE